MVVKAIFAAIQLSKRIRKSSIFLNILSKLRIFFTEEEECYCLVWIDVDWLENWWVVGLVGLHVKVSGVLKQTT